MKHRKLLAVLMFAISIPALAADADNNPPGPAGGRGTNWENRPGPQGGPGAGPDQRPRLSPEQREKMKTATPEERQQLIQDVREKRQEQRENRQEARRDRDNNPPGPVGGRGTNWENRPGPQGGPGAGPNRQQRPRQ